MKGLLYIYFLFITFLSNGQIKNGIITYAKSNSKKVFTDKNDSNYEKFSFIENKMIEALKEIEFTLNFIPKESCYQKVKTIKTENDKFFKMALAPYGNSIFYSSENTNLEQKNIFGEVFLVSKNKLDWKLINETKKIGDYNCFKAETVIKKMYRGKEKEYKKIAWYSPEINAPFGPIGYGGLPGLILELNDGIFIYKVKKIALNVVGFKSFKAPTKGKKVTEKEMDNMINKALGNFRNNRG